MNLKIDIVMLKNINLDLQSSTQDESRNGYNGANG